MKALLFSALVLLASAAQAKSVYNVIFDTQEEAAMHCSYPDRVTAYYKLDNHKFKMAGWVCQKGNNHSHGGRK